MSGSNQNEAQIIVALKHVESGRSVEDVAREQGVSNHAIYVWKGKSGGMEVSEAEEVKHLRNENSRLKKLVADLIHHFTQWDDATIFAKFKNYGLFQVNPGTGI